VKKGIEINKDVFKRASSTKVTREFTISERTKSTNIDQSVADFVASQKRTSNTKGQESELAKDWDRFSDKGSSSPVATPATKSNTQDKPKQRKLTTAQRVQVEAHKLVQKKSLRPVWKPITSEASSYSPAESNLELEGIMPSGAGSARLSGEDASDTGGGNAVMGHHVGARVSSVRFDRKDVDDAAGQALMGRQVSKQAGETLLERRDHKAALSTVLGNTEAPKAELAEGDEGSDTAGKNEESVLSSRLAEKKSKIRSQSVDITMDSGALQERSDKP
jgi:hypothetical protein